MRGGSSTSKQEDQQSPLSVGGGGGGGGGADGDGGDGGGSSGGGGDGVADAGAGAGGVGDSRVGGGGGSGDGGCADTAVVSGSSLSSPHAAPWYPNNCRTTAVHGGRADVPQPIAKRNRLSDFYTRPPEATGGVTSDLLQPTGRSTKRTNGQGRRKRRERRWALKQDNKRQSVTSPIMVVPRLQKRTVLQNNTRRMTRRQRRLAAGSGMSGLLLQTANSVRAGREETDQVSRACVCETKHGAAKVPADERGPMSKHDAQKVYLAVYETKHGAAKVPIDERGLRSKHEAVQQPQWVAATKGLDEISTESIECEENRMEL